MVLIVHYANKTRRVCWCWGWWTKDEMPCSVQQSTNWAGRRPKNTAVLIIPCLALPCLTGSRFAAENCCTCALSCSRSTLLIFKAARALYFWPLTCSKAGKGPIPCSLDRYTCFCPNTCIASAFALLRVCSLVHFLFLIVI
jgi:hypothetical protein